MAYFLEPGEPVGEGLARIAREQVACAAAEAFRRSEPASRRIHKARTTCKKIRAVLRLYRSLGREDVRQAQAFYRTVDDPLSALRDAEMLLTTFDGVVRQRPRRFSRLRSALAAQQRGLAGSAQSREAALRAFARSVRVAGTVPGPRLAQEGIEGIADDLRGAYRKGLRRFRRAKSGGKAADFHGWRKASKVVGYHHRLLQKVWPPFLAALRHQWDELSDLLGAEHDLSVLIDALDDYAGTGDEIESCAEVAAMAQKLRTTARRSALKLGGVLFADRPGRWQRRVVGEWSAAAGASQDRSAALPAGA